MRNWQKVYEHEVWYKAEMVKSILDDNNLNPVILNKRDSAYNTFGKYEIMVPPDHVLRAIKIINDETTLR
ncbi:MAG: DUF2007 domain-containing protein [Bacteroidota bacterium]